MVCVNMVAKSCFHFLLSSMKVEHLEPELRDKIRASKGPDVHTVYFNKGL